MDAHRNKDAEDLEVLVASHRAELAAARAAESDLDLAFRLQLEEAFAASLSSLPSSSSSFSPPPPPPLPPPPSTNPEAPSSSTNEDSDLSHILELQALELERFHQERADAELRAAELCRAAADMRRLAHDERFAREVDAMPDDEWEDCGDNFERPFDASRERHEEEEEPFRLYFKGLASTDHVRGEWVRLAAVGVAVCDPLDNLVLKVQKPVAVGASGACHEVLEAKALIEGLNAVISLGIKRVNVFFDFRVFYNHVIGKWRVKQAKVANMVNQVLLLQRKFERCGMFLLPRCHVKFVFKLARDAIDSQITKNIENLNGGADLKEACNICLEDTESSQMFTVDGCLHFFCFSCMKQHVEVKLLHGMLPGCPHDGCKVMLNLESSKKFLSPRLYEIMSYRMKEASIPAAEKVYCPYPRCSALMSRSEIICPQQDHSFKHYVTDTSGLRKCIKCNGSFCVNCKVPWHVRMSCYDYKQLNPHLRAEDARLQTLAKQKLWKQCSKCKHMIELAEGCFHITCRCGYEFCYTCGAEWKDKKATCTCPLWDEGYIWHDDNEDEDSEEESYDEEDEDYDYSDDEYYDNDYHH